MKKLIAILIILTAIGSYAQQNPVFNSLSLDDKTTTERDAYSGTIGRVRIIYNTTTGQIEYRVGTGAWTALGGGGVGPTPTISEVLAAGNTVTTDILPVGLNGTDLGNSTNLFTQIFAREFVGLQMRINESDNSGDTNQIRISNALGVFEIGRDNQPNNRIRYLQSDGYWEFGSGSPLRVRTLAGTGSRMVVADANGELFTQPIPGGGGAADGNDFVISGNLSGEDLILTIPNQSTPVIDLSAFALDTDLDGYVSTSLQAQSIDVNGITGNDWTLSFLNSGITTGQSEIFSNANTFRIGTRNDGNTRSANLAFSPLGATFTVDIDNPSNELYNFDGTYNSDTDVARKIDVDAAVAGAGGSPTYSAPENVNLNGLADFTVTDANIHNGPAKVINQISTAETIAISLSNVNTSEIDVFSFDSIDETAQLDISNALGFIGQAANTIVRLSGIGGVDFIETGANTGVFKVIQGDGVTFPVISNAPVIEGFTNNWANGIVNATVNNPAGVVVDEGVFILVGTDLDQAAPVFSQASAPTGFTFSTNAGNDTSDNQIANFYKVADGTEGADFTVSVANNDWWISALRISGINTANPIGTTGTTEIVAFGSSITIPEITTTNANSLVVAFVGTDGSDVNYTSLTGAGWVLGEAVEGASATDNTNGVWIYKEMPTAGATGSPTVSFDASDGLVGFMFEIRGE